ncbi:MAG: M20/M25/M40 family metallo-hydrolase [Bacteroidota bacterium]
MQLLKQLCSIHAPSGNEGAMTSFLLDYINTHKNSWRHQPQIFEGDGFQNCIVLVFGQPRTAVYAHIDSIGYTVRYKNQLVKVGGPAAETGAILLGEDSLGKIECSLVNDKNESKLSCRYHREIDRGTDLSYKPVFREDDQFVQCCYLDNRLGVWNALKLCETLKDGAIAFSCWEEHGGGSASYLSRFLYEKYDVKQALISDITWVTEGVPHGNGVVISLRDTGIPRRIFVEKIISLAKSSGIPFQLEVEGSGGSDGTEIQKVPYPIDWCFIGAPEDHVHTPDEKVHKKDIETMLKLYQYLLEKL